MGSKIGWAIVLSAVIISMVLSGCAAKAPMTNNLRVPEAARLDGHGQTDAALAVLDQTIRDRQEGSVAWNNRGTLYIKKHLIGHAIADCSCAIALKETGLYYANRGTAGVLRGFYDEAITDFNKAEGLGYRDPASTTFREKAYWDKGRYDQAVKQFTTAIADAANQLLAYGLRGTTLAILGRYAEALLDFGDQSP